MDQACDGFEPNKVLDVKNLVEDFNKIQLGPKKKDPTNWIKDVAIDNTQIGSVNKKHKKMTS
jgi:hypothetical protein